MITTAIAALSLAIIQHQGTTPIQCAVQNEAASPGVAKVDFNGVRYSFCCGGCPEAFASSPAKYVKSAIDNKKTIGESLFDPVTGAKLDPKKKYDLTQDYLGTRYYFTSADNAKAFAAKPDAFGKAPEKSALYCPVAGKEMKSYTEAGAYSDYKGVRYFFCCTSCQAGFKKDADKYADAMKTKVGAPPAVPAPRS